MTKEERKIYMREYRKGKGKEISKKASKVYYLSKGKNKHKTEKSKADSAKRQKIYRDKHPEKIKAYRLKSRYGLENIVKPDKCDVCGFGGTICIDHNHTTKKVRGFLCRGCNLAIGNAKDSPTILLGLSQYLRRNYGH